ncbi:MAG: zinc ribbon domain-containing protein [Methanomassiliicoccales archaeon]|nr:MAG: zinc ribbon domain-containing protein [Methanomassiliicoccales archaeon]
MPTCPNCNATLAEGAMFCDKCGTKMPEPGAAAPAPVAPPPAAPSSAPPAAQPYQPPPQYPAYGPQPQQPYAGQPPEAATVQSMLAIGGIIALLLGILFLLAGVGLLALWATRPAFMFVDPLAGAWIWALIPIIFGVVNFLIFFQTRSISTMVERSQYQEAKSKTLIWMILGFVLSGVIAGIVLLIAYLKFDPLIRHSQPQMYAQVQPYQQQPAYQQPYQPPPQQPQPPQPPQNP